MSFGEWLICTVTSQKYKKLFTWNSLASESKQSEVGSDPLSIETFS